VCNKHGNLGLRLIALAGQGFEERHQISARLQCNIWWGVHCRVGICSVTTARQAEQVEIDARNHDKCAVLADNLAWGEVDFRALWSCE